jgi:hypothetical protein
MLNEDNFGRDEWEFAQSIYILTNMSVKAPRLRNIQSDSNVGSFTKNLLIEEAKIEEAESIAMRNSLYSSPKSVNQDKVELDDDRLIQELLTY